MTQKHTKGEWRVEDLSHRQRGDDLSIFTLTPKHKNPRYIARVYGEGVLARGEGIDTERNANARLIAASPELLDALKHAKQFLHEVYCKYPEDAKYGAMCLDKTNAAIAKAETN